VPIGARRNCCHLAIECENAAVSASLAVKEKNPSDRILKLTVMPSNWKSLAQELRN
jgi:hypothetical protein